MKDIFVIGGAGFIGSNFIRTLLQMEQEVRIFNLDALTYAGCLEVSRTCLTTPVTPWRRQYL